MVDVTLTVAYVVYTVVNGQVVTPVDVTLRVIHPGLAVGRLLKHESASVSNTQIATLTTANLIVLKI